MAWPVSLSYGFRCKKHRLDVKGAHLTEAPELKRGSQVDNSRKQKTQFSCKPSFHRNLRLGGEAFLNLHVAPTCFLSRVMRRF